LTAGAQRQQTPPRAQLGGQQRRGGVGGTGGYRQAGAEAELLGGGGQQGARDLSGRADLGEEVGAQAEGLSDVSGPGAAGQVEQERARGVGRVGGDLDPTTGQAQAEPVLRLEHPASQPVGVGLVPGHPDQQRAGHAGRRGVAEPGPQIGGQPLVVGYLG
jgi:hypothetical protein